MPESKVKVHHPFMEFGFLEMEVEPKNATVTMDWFAKLAKAYVAKHGAVAPGMTPKPAYNGGGNKYPPKAPLPPHPSANEMLNDERGQWPHATNRDCKCSECGTQIASGTQITSFSKEKGDGSTNAKGQPAKYYWNFCGNCWNKLTALQPPTPTQAFAEKAFNGTSSSEPISGADEELPF